MIPPRGTDVRAFVSAAIAKMHPAYFAMPMATGIVAIACHLLGLRALSGPFFWINVFVYGSIVLATICRAVVFRREFVADWTHHGRSPGYFTTVAATCMLGTQAVLLRGSPRVGIALWFVGVTLWLICTYAVFAALTIGERKPSLAEGINGGWLVAVVATQSVCVLGCAALPGRFGDRDTVLFVLTAFWLCGGMLYIWLIALIFYRYTFFKFSPADLLPPYWINMGAVAISTLAGTALLGASGSSVFMASIRPFVLGFTILFWATATWWIPLLLVLGFWRHVLHRVRFSYDPLYWGLVFPLGMYSVCTFRLGFVCHLPFLTWIARFFIVTAIIAWTLAFGGWLTRLLYAFILAIRGAPSAYLRLRAPSAVPVYPCHQSQQPSVGGSS